MSKPRGVRLSYGEICEIKTNSGRVLLRVRIQASEDHNDGPTVQIDMDGRSNKKAPGAGFDWSDRTARRLRDEALAN